MGKLLSDMSVKYDRFQTPGVNVGYYKDMQYNPTILGFEFPLNCHTESTYGSVVLFFGFFFFLALKMGLLLDLVSGQKNPCN